MGTDQAVVGAAAPYAPERRDISIHCPADGRLVGVVPEMGSSEIDGICTELRKAQPAWEALGPAGRRTWLLRWVDWLFDNERRLLELVRSETGKSWADASREMAVAGAQAVLKYCRQQSVVEPRFALTSEPLRYPVIPVKSRLMAKAVRLVGAHDWRRRLGRYPR